MKHVGESQKNTKMGRILIIHPIFLFFMIISATLIIFANENAGANGVDPQTYLTTQTKI